MTPTDHVEELRQEIARLREQMKERETSVIVALRTLLNDSLECLRERRGFPVSALLGLASAYSRPRVVLIVGSVVGLALACIQVWLLLTQNGLVDQQNRLLAEQGRALNAQTIAILLGETDGEQQVPQSHFALLLGLGDLGFEALFRLANDYSPIGQASRKAIWASFDRLSATQRQQVFFQALNFDLEKVLLEASAQEKLLLRPWMKMLQHSGKIDPNVPIVLQVPHSIATRIELSVFDDAVTDAPTTSAFLYETGFNARHLADISMDRRGWILRRLALYYAAILGAAGPSSDPSLNDFANAFCGLSARSPPDIDGDLMKLMLRAPPSEVSVFRHAHDVLQRHCRPTAMRDSAQPVTDVYETHGDDFTWVDTMFIVSVWGPEKSNPPWPPGLTIPLETSLSDP